MSDESHLEGVDGALVRIPGELLCDYNGAGRITGWTFLAVADHPGFPDREPVAVIAEADEPGWRIDVEAKDGEFWKAVRADVDSGEGLIVVEWETMEGGYLDVGDDDDDDD